MLTITAQEMIIDPIARTARYAITDVVRPWDPWSLGYLGNLTPDEVNDPTYEYFWADDTGAERDIPDYRVEFDHFW